jgi:cellulose biosynthesis protein BcsQ
LRIRFLINRANPRTTLAKTIRETLVDTYSIKIMDTVLCDREAFKQSLHTGQSVIEHDSNSRGAIEMGNLVVEVSKILKSKKKD